MLADLDAYRFAVELADLDLDPFDQLLERSGEAATREARRLVEESVALVRGEALEALSAARPAVRCDRFAERADRSARLALCPLGHAHEALEPASALCSGASRRRTGARGTHPMSGSTDVCSTPDGHRPGARSGPLPRQLDPMVLPDHIDVLYRAAWALCGSRYEAEDLVQDTFAQVLKRPRLLRSDNEVGYLLRALRNANAARHRAAMRRPITVPLAETDFFSDRAAVAGTFDARELMEAIAATPRLYRDAVVAVDIVGLSYRQAARHLRTREVTITSRLSRGRHHIARALGRPAGADRGRWAKHDDRVSVLDPGVESSRDR